MWRCLFVCLLWLQSSGKENVLSGNQKTKNLTYTVNKNINSRSIVDPQTMKGKNSKALEDNIRK